MAKKTFALEMNGIEIKTLEDLRENFNLEKAVDYFQSGELLDWLNDRFYDDEAEKIENISPDDKNLSQKICAALNVECDEDLEFTQRIREKKKILEEKTDDQNIIDNATTTALNQDDLANLLNMDYQTIFLCGENFTVPIRVSDKKYIGVLSTPKIKIKANSQEELDAKNISFENCILPFMKVIPIEELKTIIQKIFGNNWKNKVNNLDKNEKSLVFKMICHGKYIEEQVIYVRFTEDLSSGFAFTTDSFCVGGIIGNKLIKYVDINNLSLEKKGAPSWSYVLTINDISFASWPGYANNIEICKKLFGKHDSGYYEQVKKFLDIVKNF